jgi:hypothetical protein
MMLSDLYHRTYINSVQPVWPYLPNIGSRVIKGH